MKLIAALLFIDVFMYVFTSESEETARRRYPYDYKKYHMCGDNALATCVRSNGLYSKTPANEQELHNYCTSYIPLVKCYDKEHANCLGFNPYEHEHAFLLATLEKTCDEESEWHKALIKHLPCAAREITSYNDTCPGKIEEITEAVSKVLNFNKDKYEHLNDISDEEIDEIGNYWCFKNALELVCLQMKIENCGTEASNLSLEIIISLSYYKGSCSKDHLASYYSAVGSIGLTDKEVNTIRNILQIWFENYVQLQKDLNEE